MRTLPILLCCLAFVPVTVPAADAVDELNRAVAEQHVIPRYQRLAEQTAELHRVTEARCNEGETGRRTLQKRFADAFLAWQGIQHIRFGPIQVLSRDFRFQLWPDKRGSVGKHLARLLATTDPTQLEPETFAAGSAAVQGFGALERMLFDPPGGDADTAWRCRVTVAMTGNLQRMAAETLAEWRDGDTAHRLMFATAGKGNAYYDSAGELQARLLNNLHTQLERIADQKLGRPLGDAPEKAFPRRAEAWRSALAVPAIRANLQALSELYRIGFAPQLVGNALAPSLDDAFNGAIAVLDAAPAPLAGAITDPVGWAAFDGARQSVLRVKALVGGELTETLGLPLGFNSLDGD